MLSYKFRSPHYRALMQHTACILFTPNGVIKEASPLFLDTVGYTLDEIEGEHHRLFCFPEETSRPEYTAFWQTLAAGYSQQGRFRRLNSDGKEIWLEATYIPIKNSRGKVTQIFKVASDVTAKHQNAARERAILQALDSSMAVIEFTPDGYVLNTNSNFEKTMGYAAEQIRGIHHREFCPNAFYLQYPDFWERLSRGEFMQGKFERIDARGNTIWLEATYNPIRDDQGHIIKVVKFATDITRSIQASEAAKVTVNTAQTSSIQTEKIAQSGLTQLKQILVDSEQATQTLNEAQRLIAALNQQADGNPPEKPGCSKVEFSVS